MASIKTGKVVDLSYSLKNSSGEVLDQADAKDPFTYLHGADQIVPGLEGALEGLNAGDKRDVTVAPAEGYGELDPKLKLVVSRSQFPAEMDVVPGMQFEADMGDGQGIMFTVENVQGDKVHVDGNHPLAGETLHFAVEVLNVRDATEDELSHGHAHGPEGHGHDDSHGDGHGDGHGEEGGHGHLH